MNAHQRSLPAFAVFVTAVASAAVMTACGPEKGDPVMPKVETPVIGGVVGGVVGNQIGDGNGRKVATVVGAVGGGFAGNEIEKRRGERVVGYRVSVRMDDGETRTVRVGSRDGLEVGERVRVEGNDLIRL